MPIQPRRTSFSSSREPLPPTTPTRTRLLSPERRHTRTKSFSRIRRFPMLSPRIISPIVIWSIAIYLIHIYLLPLPFPSLTNRPETSSDHHLSTYFPPPAEREGDDLDSFDSRWRPLRPLGPPDAPFPRLRPTRFLSAKCMEMWFMDGEICGDAGDEDKLDATWLWVNGSDPRWRDSMIQARVEARVYSPEHHFREQNELLYSMRSVLDALPGHLRTFHLIVADSPFQLPGDLSLLSPELVRRLGTSSGSMYRPIDAQGRPMDVIAPPVSEHLANLLAKTWRIAQTPTWFNFSYRGEADQPDLRYATHSEIFHLPSLDRDGMTEELGEREWRESKWRKVALPSFNSMAIETRVGWLPGLADVSLSLNDDFFILKPHAVSDFHSPLYGSVIRFDHGYLSQVRPIMDRNHLNDPGEGGGLSHANWLLSRRYPRRLRPYFAHAPKVITRGLHHEASLMFEEALSESSQRRFRKMSSNGGDVQMQWLLTALRVERWREALLWTYVVANIGTLEYGVWDVDAREEIDYLFGLGEGDEDVIKIEVYRGERWTLENGRIGKVFEQAGWEAPKETEFLFSSLDGHLPPTLRPDQDPNENNKCILDLEHCFGSFWSVRENVTAADMFTRLTFMYPECGDCLIMALVTASGPLGLSAFFPDKDTTIRVASGLPPKYLPPPHLPLTDTWQVADFSLDNIMSTTALPGEDVNLREYCMKLLSRYLYMSGKSVSHFHMLKTAEHAGSVFAMIQADPRVSILGLNDDIVSDYETVKMIMKAWFEHRWPKAAPWERG